MYIIFKIKFVAECIVDGDCAGENVCASDNTCVGKGGL